MTRRIDAHQHFWRYDPETLPWIGAEMPVLRQDFGPSQWREAAAACDLDGSLAVQAQQNEAETRWLLELARRPEHRILGVVGWVDLQAPDVAARLAALDEARLVGLRHIVQDEPDPEFLARPAFRRGLDAVADHGDLVYDLLVYPEQLPAAIDVVRAYPQLRFVLDHVAKPPFRDGNPVDPTWADAIATLASHGNVFCKVSGLVTEADWQSWTPGQFHAHLDAVWRAFGPNRVMFGSDWPVCLLAGTFREVFAIVDDYTANHSAAARAAFFGANAASCYGLEATP